jgi:predicted DCC family thiol-disulfide oxidoreductase YuxK
MIEPELPDWGDKRPLFIFDHVCVLCSGGVSFIMKHDRSGKIAFTPAQGALGGQLCVARRTAGTSPGDASRSSIASRARLPSAAPSKWQLPQCIAHVSRIVWEA